MDTRLYCKEDIAKLAAGRDIASDRVRLTDDVIQESAEKPTPSQIVSLTEKLPWRKSKRFGEWVYAFYEDGRMRPEAAPIMPVVEKLRSEEKLVIGGYEYALSGDRKQFLVRTPVGQKSNAEDNQESVTSVAPRPTIPNSHTSPREDTKPQSGAFVFQDDTRVERERFVEWMKLELARSSPLSFIDSRYGVMATKALLQTPGFDVSNGKIQASEFAALTRIPNYYKRLKVPSTAAREEIVEAHKAYPAEKEAYEILGSDEKRVEYDQTVQRISELFAEQAKLPSFRFVALGGGNEVGRSSYFVRVGKHYVLLDAGLKQGPDLIPAFECLNLLPPVEAAIVSHGHTDHTGAVAVLHELYPDLKFFMSADTKKTLEFDLEDQVNKGTLMEKVLHGILERCIATEGEGIDGMKFQFYNAGHIKGSRMTYLEADGDTVLYTGDVNFEWTRFQAPAEPVAKGAAVLITEATYAGKKGRTDRQQRENELVEVVAEAVGRGDKVIVAAFAKGRTGEVLDVLDDALEAGSIPDVPTYAIGLGAALATEVDRVELKKVTVLESGPGLSMNSIIVGLKERLYGDKSFVVVAGAGFLDQGAGSQLTADARLRKDATVVLTGYSTGQSTAGMLADLASNKEVMRSGVKMKAECHVVTVSLTAHASGEMLLDFISKVNPKMAIVVHTEKGREFSDELRARNIYNVYSNNLEVVFDYPHTGFRLITGWEGETLAGEKGTTIECECGLTFDGSTTAERHAETEGHNLVQPVRSYVFAIDEKLRRKGVDKILSRVHLNLGQEFEGGRLLGDRVLVRGRLDDDSIKRMESAGLTLVNFDYVYVPPKVNLRELAPSIKESFCEITGKGEKVIIPLVKEGTASEDVSGFYSPLKQMIIIPLDRLRGVEDAKLVLKHEMTHHFQYKLNESLPPLWLSSMKDPSFLEFVEGFAQYMALKMGGSRKILMVYHEEGTAEHYRKGRVKYEDVELVFGKEAALNVALNQRPEDLRLVFREATGILAGAATKKLGKFSYVREMLNLLEKNRVWRRYWIFWKGFPSSTRKEMFDYVKANWKETVKREMDSWETLTREDAQELLLLTLADYIIQRCQEDKPERERLKLALKFIFVYAKKYKKFHEKLVRLISPPNGEE